MKLVCLLLIALTVNASFALNAQQTPAQPGTVLEYLGGRGGSAPLSEAVKVGSILYLSGQLGTANGALVTGGVKGETKQVLENIKKRSRKEWLRYGPRDQVHCDACGHRRQSSDE